MVDDTNKLFTHEGKVYVLTPSSRYSCSGCAAEHDDGLCSALPACRDVETMFIFKEITGYGND